ncbi:amino-acid N-acetyltransferase [Methanohalophilus levihalophilus]|uniref:N-acetyltransferase n=1 Tax=Methanohalophilus levihalophilus TaxID=1431282 RepID=UPI001AE3B9F7|nr:N-acetyltransferase [Methanohalophilus levihalophilus]MBP2029271.1 amino-acid N-acetyltransferase [Methanohalophilus levihalophilus]
MAGLQAGLVRKATINDIESIKNIINGYAKKELMLPRSIGELHESIRNFHVYEINGEVVGCCALQVVWEDLGEVLSFAVVQDHRGKGIGSLLLQATIKDGKKLGVRKVFTLTYVPEFFEKMGFKRIEKSDLPHKVWIGCIKCPKFPDCNEVALSRTI